MNLTYIIAINKPYPTDDLYALKQPTNNNNKINQLGHKINQLI